MNSTFYLEQAEDKKSRKARSVLSGKGKEQRVPRVEKGRRQVRTEGGDWRSTGRDAILRYDFFSSRFFLFFGWRPLAVGAEASTRCYPAAATLAKGTCSCILHSPHSGSVAPPLFPSPKQAVALWRLAGEGAARKPSACGPVPAPSPEPISQSPAPQLPYCRYTPPTRFLKTLSQRASLHCVRICRGPTP